MPKVKAENLQAGDIVVFEWNSGFWHTAIFIGKVSGRGEQHMMAHCEGATHGTALDPFQSSADEARNVYGFRLPNARANALQKVLAVTRTWAPVLPSTQSTRYGTPRGSAILRVYDRDNPGQAPAFEYDALYRVFKWLTRTELFSKNQGTTCCAFVMACFQVGLMQQFFEEQGLTGNANDFLYALKSERAGKRKPNPQQAEEIFREELLTKMKLAQARKLPFKDQDLAKIRARREYSNPGTRSAAFADLTTEELWEKLKAEIAYNEDPTTLQDLFTGPLCYDARFMYSHMLYEKLRNDNAWTAVN